jgi:hypothetical protein
MRRQQPLTAKGWQGQLTALALTSMHKHKHSLKHGLRVVQGFASRETRGAVGASVGSALLSPPAESRRRLCTNKPPMKRNIT